MLFIILLHVLQYNLCILIRPAILLPPCRYHNHHRYWLSSSFNWHIYSLRYNQLIHITHTVTHSLQQQQRLLGKG